LLHAVGTKPIQSGVETHNALGAGKRYHASLWQIYRRVRADHPTLAGEHALSLALSALNQTAGPSGILPMLLLFGITPRMPVNPVDLPQQKQRNIAMRTARDEMQRHVARDRLRNALRTRVPRASDSPIAEGMTVLLYSEKPVNRWVGPFTVVNTDDKLVWLDHDGQVKQFSIDKVKQYRVSKLPHTDHAIAKSAPAQSAEAGAQHRTLEPDLSVREIDDEDLDELTDVIRVGDQLLGNVADGMGKFSAAPCKAESSNASEANITEVLEAGDSRIQSERFQLATQAEVDGLLSRGTMKVVKRQALPKGANLVGGRFVHTIKHVGSPE